MNRAQRIWILVGLCALVISCVFAPYSSRSALGGSETVYAPVWAGMNEGDLGALGRGAYYGGILDVGKLALTWAAIVIVAVAGVALSKRQP